MGGYTGAKFAQTKRCSKCKQVKPRDEFSVRTDGYLFAACRSCSAAHKRARWRANRPKALELCRQHSIRVRHGITYQQFDELSAKQGGRCAICDSEARKADGRVDKLCVDHCHRTNRIRGLLCNRCNRAIGLLADDAELLRRAIEYLRSADSGLRWESRIGMGRKRRRAAA